MVCQGNDTAGAPAAGGGHGHGHGPLPSGGADAPAAAAATAAAAASAPAPAPDVAPASAPCQGEPYKPRCILLTGGAGFIGSHVAIRLVKRYPDVKVVVYDSLEYCASTKNLAAVQGRPNFKFVKGDVSSADLVRFVLEAESVDTVMHFAAQTHVDNSFGNSLAFTMGNTYGTHVLLECARVYGGVRRFINVSTDEVYGESSLGKSEGLGEHSVLEPTNPYSAAKAGAEMMAKAYLTSYKMPVIVTRGNNVYGPHQFPEKMIPKFTLLASRGRPLPIHGDGLAVRSYLYVEDVAAAFETVLLRGAVGEVYNIGTQKERSVLSVAADISRAFAGDGGPAANKGSGGEKGAAAGSATAAGGNVTHVRDRAFNDRRYFICDKKLLALGWREEVDWETGLARTIAWYRGQGGKRSYWENGDMDAALEPHPTLQASGLVRAIGGGGASGSGGGGGSSSGGGGGGGASGSGSDGGGGRGDAAGVHGGLGRVPSFIAGGPAAAAAADPAAV